MDRYVERLVKCNASPAGIAGMVAGVILTVAGAILLISILPQFAILFLVAGIALFVFSKDQTELEYEYILTNGDIEISKIISKKRRKLVRNIVADSITLMDRAEAERTKNDISIGKYSVKKYVGKEPDTVVALYTGEGAKQEIILVDFNEDCIDHMKQTIKNKCNIT